MSNIPIFTYQCDNTEYKHTHIQFANAIDLIREEAISI